MRSGRFLTSMVILFLAVMIACEKEDQSEEVNQNIYFEYYSYNLAWGFNYGHWIIDNAGNVRISSREDTVIWIEDDLENLDWFDSIIYKVDTMELKRYKARVTAAGRGDVACFNRQRRDFGTIAFNCYKGNKLIPLSLTNDTRDCKNTNVNAMLIEMWLMGIHNTISRISLMKQEGMPRSLD
jgi:hypothetical protein